jgi:hypothetical protein
MQLLWKLAAWWKKLFQPGVHHVGVGL